MSDWKSVVATVAPTLATALGGPLAGLAVASIGKAFGLDSATEEQVSQAIAGATPENLLALKNSEYDFQKHMADLGVDLERIASNDRDSARKREMEVKDNTNKVLAYAILGGFLATVGATLLGYAKVDSALAGTLVGYISAKAELVLAYYFGSSAGSDRKTELMGKK